MSEPISDEQYLRDQEWRDEIADEHERLMAQIATLAAERAALVRALDDELMLSGYPPLALTSDPYSAARRAIAEVLSFALLIERDPAVNADLRALLAERDALRDEMRGVRAVQEFLLNENADLKCDGEVFWCYENKCQAASLPALGHALIQEGHVDGE